MGCYPSKPIEPPLPDPTGNDIVDWYQQLFEKSTTFASILAAVMFSAMILDFDTISVPHGGDHEVRTWAAAGSVLFVLLVLLCTGCSLFLRFGGKWIARQYDEIDGFVRFMLAFGSFLFQGLLLAGTMFFCLVVKAYVPAVGWTAFGITSVYLLFSLGLWTYQLCTEISTQFRIRRKEKKNQDTEGNNRAGQRKPCVVVRDGSLEHREPRKII
jgi:hypothetical protein